MHKTFPQMAAVIPEGEKGRARVKHVGVSASDSALTGIRALVSGRPGEVVREGTYAQLFVDGQLVMSDTQMERRSNLGVIWNARGDVLIAGLGLGMIVVPLLAGPDVTSVTVIEQCKDVIDLVEPHVRRAAGKNAPSKLAVIEADIFEWKPPKGQKWDCIYFDIWADICTDNLDDMAKLHRRFGRRKNPGGWMGSWKQDDLKRVRAQERREEQIWGMLR
jgi:spermidine synthase